MLEYFSGKRSEILIPIERMREMDSIGPMGLDARFGLIIEYIPAGLWLAERKTFNVMGAWFICETRNCSTRPEIIPDFRQRLEISIENRDHLEGTCVACRETMTYSRDVVEDYGRYVEESLIVPKSAVWPDDYAEILEERLGRPRGPMEVARQRRLQR